MSDNRIVPLRVISTGHQIEASALLKAAENSDTQKQKDQRCGVHFYLGEYHLINERKNEARTLLVKAEQECPKSFAEYNAAVAELRRLSR